MRALLLTNIPAPYRVPVFNRVADQLGKDFRVLFCAPIEANRNWDPGSIRFDHAFLKENVRNTGGDYIHSNLDVVRQLHQFAPEAVITSGFNPTSLYAWAYSMVRGWQHIPMTDGWIHSESSLGPLHRAARIVVYRSSSAFIGASRKSAALYRSYGVPEEKIFTSHLCVDNERFRPWADQSERPFDVMFSGQIIERKLPGFFIEVVRRLVKVRPALKVLVIGSGPLREEFLRGLAETGAGVVYPGHIQQKDLPAQYAQAKILMFTTRNDPWGIVANEAMASGTVVLTSPFAGVTDDLVFDGANGFVRELSPEAWADCVIPLLDDPVRLATLRAEAVRAVAAFNFDIAAQGILDALYNSKAR